ncbi:rRNA maturation RNase YbeY [Gayadomonas joobiniege]|uniref:rRNA maturation RNase YbeY n=1 Tax=Gayadomonas joobiniege TaxID=1234606 RepID=UPI000379F7B7|nr:rRNA maturation RNase YbeY [Gayadomonas joobiniege]
MPEQPPAGVDLDLQIATQTDQLPSEEEFRLWASRALAEQGHSELSIRIVDANESQQLNHAYRGKNKATNVLSFPFQSPPGLTIKLPFVGDLVICAEVVFTEAAAQNKTAKAHWAHMVVHGCLHLLGYDHIEAEDAQVMENLEIKILTQLGFDDPYHID